MESINFPSNEGIRILMDASLRVADFGFLFTRASSRYLLQNFSNMIRLVSARTFPPILQFEISDPSPGYGLAYCAHDFV